MFAHCCSSIDGNVGVLGECEEVLHTLKLPAAEFGVLEGQGALFEGRATLFGPSGIGAPTCQVELHFGPALVANARGSVSADSKIC